MQPLTPQAGADLPRLLQLIGLPQDASLVLGAEPAPHRLRDRLGVRERSDRIVGPDARPPGSLWGRRFGADLARIRIHHQFLASPPSLISDGVMVSTTLTQTEEDTGIRVASGSQHGAQSDGSG